VVVIPARAHNEGELGRHEAIATRAAELLSAEVDVEEYHCNGQMKFWPHRA
jgi:hypothetical protein